MWLLNLQIFGRWSSRYLVTDSPDMWPLIRPRKTSILNQFAFNLCNTYNLSSLDVAWLHSIFPVIQTPPPVKLLLSAKLSRHVRCLMVRLPELGKVCSAFENRFGKAFLASPTMNWAWHSSVSVSNQYHCSFDSFIIVIIMFTMYSVSKHIMQGEAF
jgi:hypothetical protein